MPPVKGNMLAYSEDSMLNAIKDVQLGMAVSTAAKKHKVPRITLLYKVRGKTPVSRKMGPKTILTDDEEKLLENWIISAAKLKFPISKTQLLDSVQQIIKDINRETPFADNRPGRAWFEGFRKRHPCIRERVAQNLTATRASITKTAICNWFDEINNYLKNEEKLDILEDGSRLFNADESAFFLNPKGGKVLAEKGNKSIYQQVNSDEKECLTVLVNANAEGTFAPTMIVFKYKKIPSDVAKSVPKDWGIGKSDSGWMNGELFYEYITNIFYPWIIENNIRLPIIMFIDGHTSHLTLHTSKFCDEKGIILIALFPNATHVLQPLDIGFFKPLKTQWKEEVYKWRIANIDKPLLKKCHFAPLLQSTFNSIDNKIMKNAFRKSGLFPWNKNAVDYSKIIENETNNIKTSNSELIPITSTSNLLNDKAGLYFIENEIGRTKLDLFKRCLVNWDGPERDKSLFILWKQVSDRVATTVVSAQTTNPDNTTEAASAIVHLNTEQHHPTYTETTTSVTLNETLASNYLLPEVFNDDTETTIFMESTVHNAADGTLDTLNDVATVSFSQAHEDYCTPVKVATGPICPSPSPFKKAASGLIIPSPFKKSLFWPEPKPIISKRAKKEKVPAVVSSKGYQQYLEKKMEEKERKEQIKLEKAITRKAKQEENKIKRLSRENKIKRRKIREDTSESENEWNESGSSTQDCSFEMDANEFIQADCDPLVNVASTCYNENEIQINLEEIKQTDCDPLALIASTCSDETQINLNDFVISKFAVRNKNKYFVGKIVDIICGEGFEISFLKHDEGGKFKWPLIEDKSFVSTEDVVIKLPACQIDRRERLYFNFNFEPYNI